MPTRNEAGNIPELLQRLQASLAGIEFELIFVDDSDDPTPDLLVDAARQEPRLRVLHRPPEARAGGLSTAAVLGLREARGRTACLMDADLQHPPETIPRLLEAERAGADVVVASRYVEGGSVAGLNGGFRRLLSRGSNMVARAVFVEARASTDPGTGFFLCRTTVLRGLEFRPVGFKTLLELLVCSSGIRVVDVPLVFEARRAGTTKATAAQGWLVLRDMWSLVRDVPGSARRWKFAVVGVCGLLIFLTILDVCGVVLRWNPLLAWAVAFSISLAWNFALNLRITFADLRRARYPLLGRYISYSITAGAAQLVIFVGLLHTHLPLVLDGLLSALAGMGVNASLYLQIIHRYHRPLDEPIGVDAGARPLTFSGLTGLGDCILTCMSPHSRNRLLGVAMAQGRGLDEVVASTLMVAEGVNATRAVVRLAERHGVEMPIALEIHAVLFEGKPIATALSDRMGRGPADELRGLRLSGLQGTLPSRAGAGAVPGRWT